MLVSAVMVLVMLLAVSDSALGRSVRSALGSLRLPRVTPGRVALLLFVFAAVALVMMWVKGEGLALIGPAIPEALAWFAAFDVAAYLDVIAVMAVLAVTVRFRAARAMVRDGLAWGMRVVRTTRARAHRRSWRRPRLPSRGTDAGEGRRGLPAFA
jgi:hypothetical protein